MRELCQRCGDDDPDLRTLRMACFYQMYELDVPFDQDGGGCYTLRVCKECRASWMKTIERWFHDGEQQERTGTGVFVRDKGVALELTDDEVERLFPS